MCQIPHAHLQNVQACQRQCFPRAWCQKAVPALTWVKKTVGHEQNSKYVKISRQEMLEKKSAQERVEITYH